MKKIELIIGLNYIYGGKQYTKDKVYGVDNQTANYLLGKKNERDIPYFRLAAFDEADDSEDTDLEDSETTGEVEEVVEEIEDVVEDLTPQQKAANTRAANKAAKKAKDKAVADEAEKGVAV